MKKNRRKILSLLLAAIMVVTTYHVPSRAAGSDKISDKILDQLGGSVAKDGAYLNVPKLGDREEDETGEIKPIDLSEVLRVSIVLEKPGTIEAGYPMKNIAKNSSAIAYRNSLKAQQAAMTARIEQVTGKKLDVVWNITLGANIISANMTRGDMIKIANVSGIKEVFVENIYTAPITEPNTSTTPGMIGSDTGAWANGFYGAGSKIMIIDTGTNQDHLSFSGEALEYALTKDGKSLDDYDLMTQADVAVVASQLNAGNGINAAQAYKSLKIPYSYNYCDHNYATDHSADGQGEHGSHVSGIAAANRFVKQNGEFVDALEAVLACGVAPDAQILTAKVFGNAHAGAADSDYFIAIEDAIILGADAVNLSLGSGVAGFAFSDRYQDKMDMLADNGLVMVTSAGNSYAFNSFGGRQGYGNSGVSYNYIEDVNLSTNGSPGSFLNTLGVASADNVGMTDTPLVFNGDQIVYYWESTMNTQKNPPIPYGNPEIKTIAGTYDYVYVDAAGAEADLAAVNEAVSLKGKVVMVNRGGISFAVKANNVVQYEPAAFIVVNNESGEIYMSLADTQGNNLFEGDFPVVSMSLENGQILKSASQSAAAGSLTYYTGKVEVKDEMVSSVVADEPMMSDFSSWGGSGALIMKPEITAPGGNIWSVNGMTNDGFENMSGTSMAAPQVTGMMALFGEYYRAQLKAYVDAAFSTENFSERQMAHSLLMSTSVPLLEADSGTYYPVLRQGSGLANIGNALAARSFLMVKDDATVSAADGKVKAELGQSTEGKYSYTFTIYNPSENDLIYDLSTDLFTQDVFGVGGLNFMDEWAFNMDGTVTYDFSKSTKLHDVDKDDDTDTDDVQAILDYLSGERDGSDLDLTTPVADLDEDGKVTSYDAVLLLNWLYSMNDETEDTDTVLVPAGTSKDVKVTIDVSSWDAAAYPSGMWVEGYTFVTCNSISEDGALLEVEHSIPLLGFYGSFTEASMYDANSYTGVLYGNPKMTYGNDPYTNYMLIRYEGEKKSTVFTGNPYALEDEFPAERLAINSGSMITGFHYDLIRAAGTIGLLVREADEDRNVTDEILQLTLEGKQYPDYFYVNESRWDYSDGRVTKSGSVTVGDLGLQEGDVFNISRYAIPEYYAMQLNGSTASTLTEDELKQLLTSTDPATALGDGVFLGFTLKVDDTAPAIDPVESDPDSDEITVTFRDNEYVAFVAIMDPSGSTVYDGYVPEQSEAGETLSLTIKKSDYAAGNAVTVLVADYAGNESAFVVRTGDGPIMAEEPYTIYVPAKTLENGKEYMLTITNAPGNTIALDCYGNGYYLGRDMSYISSGEFDEYSGLYIASEDMNAEMLFTADGTAGSYIQGSFFLTNETEDGTIVYLRNYGERPVTMAFDGNLYYGLFWQYTENALLSPYYSRYVALNAANNYSSVMSANPYPLYLWEPMEITVLAPYDPFTVSTITVDPSSYTLIPSLGQTSVQLTATVEPQTAEDKAVVWTSSDETVATVDENGLVTAVSLGSVAITATAHDGGGASAKAVINIVEENPMPEGTVVYGQVEKADGTVEFVEINLHDMTTRTVAAAPDEMAGYPFIGGGRSRGLIWGTDQDDDLSLYDVTDGYGFTYLGGLDHDEAFRDAANLPELVFSYQGRDFPLVLSAFSNADVLQLMTPDGGYLSFDMSDDADFVAITFVECGTDKDQNGALRYYDYFALDAQGQVWYLELYQYEDELDDVHLDGGVIATLDGFAVGDDLSAYSLVFAADQTGVSSMFLADNTSKSVWYIDMQAVSTEGTFTAVYVGALAGVTSLSTLYNNTFDSVETVTSAGTDQPGRIRGSISASLTEMKAELTMDKLQPAAQEPAEEPTVPETEPVTEPAEVPTEPTAEPVEEPSAPETEPAAEPAEVPTEPAEETTEVPAEAVTEPAEVTTEAPAEDTTGAPAEEVTEPAEAPAEEAEDTEIANPVAGGLNAAILTVARSGKPEGAVMLRSSVVTETDNDDSLLLSLTDEEDVTNGIVTLTYDTDVLKFVGVTNPAAAGADVDDMFFSAHEDEDAGTVTFVYAVRSAVEAGDEIAELEFEKPCEDTVILVASSERNQDQDLDEKDEMDVEGSGHDWKLDSVKWEGDDASGYTKVTFTFICGNNAEHVEVVVDEKIDAVTDANGGITYTAEVTGPDGKTYTETKKIAASTPETGDVSDLPLFITMGTTATAAFVGVMCIRRKKEDEED